MDLVYYGAISCDHTFYFSDVPWAHGQKFILPVLWQEPLNAGGLCLRGGDGE